MFHQAQESRLWSYFAIKDNHKERWNRYIEQLFDKLLTKGSRLLRHENLKCDNKKFWGNWKHLVIRRFYIRWNNEFFFNVRAAVKSMSKMMTLIGLENHCWNSYYLAESLLQWKSFEATECPPSFTTWKSPEQNLRFGK